ncbi:LysR substrate-binding domain-containing protein [Kribbella albertanoniae]|uniref:LysR family transcriptional regulator n=1 Tax=Kribbella albertanoniae TaxID=1266829 RepID=A0A4R4Q8C5_9ACTN|nr:LysR family transcriptional regulator [Kribbella albertanoniae]TDC31279.1 LysR family transcriptional regulator [Kribbella albertanoniae]
MDLSLRLLQALAAVAEDGSMTRAARRLNLTQQAVSGQIRQLERIVGTPLVVRLSSGIELTAAGQVVLKQGEALLSSAEAMMSEARMVGAARSEPLRIAFKAQSTAHFMPAVEAALRRQAPDLEVQPISSHTLPEEIEALVEGRADAAFLWLPIGDDPRFVIHPLLAEDRWVALPPGHPLSERNSLTIADLADVPVVGPREGMPEAVVSFWFIDPRPDGSRAVFGPEGRTPEECLHLVAAGHGCWIAPASTVTYFAHPRLVWLPLVDAPPNQLALMWAVHNPNPYLPLLLQETSRVLLPAN